MEYKKEFDEWNKKKKWLDKNNQVKTNAEGFNVQNFIISNAQQNQCCGCQKLNSMVHMNTLMKQSTMAE